MKNCDVNIGSGRDLLMYECISLSTFCRYKDDSDAQVEEGAKPKVQYGVEFTFDADARVAITLYCQAFEEFSNGMAV